MPIMLSRVSSALCEMGLPSVGDALIFLCKLSLSFTSTTTPVEGKVSQVGDKSLCHLFKTVARQGGDVRIRVLGRLS